VPEPDPTTSLLVTLALSAADAEKIVFAAEFGSIWLSHEPSTADESGTDIVDGTKVYG
jgi:pilus assembly protein CpaB